jgi:hypothetical protein
MKQNTKTSTKKTAAQPKAQKACAGVCRCQSVVAQENKIIGRSILVTSLLFNLFFLVGWVMTLASSDYAQTLGRVIYNM